MKRTLLAAIAAVLLSATGAMAGVQNTPHDMVNTWTAGARQGICSYCHVPHSAQGARLWPSVPDAGIAASYGVVGSLCYSCHATGVVLGTSTANGVSNTVFNSAAGIYNHHLANPATASYPNTDTTAVNAASPVWPWTNSAVGPMECTSCHNVHTQTAASSVAGYASARNFLRSPYYLGTADVPTEMFCDRCHANRTSPLSRNALGTHPVGGVVAPGDTARGGVHAGHVAGNITYPISAGNLVPLYEEEGGHTTTGLAAGGTVCWTCHQPHGADEKLIFQTRYNTAALGASSICQSCHGTRPSLSEAADTFLFHPVNAGTDDDIVVRGGLNVTITVARPFSGNLGDSTSSYASVLNAYSGTSGEVVCLSCHGVHEAAPSTPIFRQEKISVGTGICDDCHQTVMAGASHPVNVTMTNEHGGVWPNTGGLPLFTGNVRCETCHAGHNGAVGARFILRRTDANSEICVDCHTPTNTSTQAIFPATNGATTVSNSANPSQYIMETLYDGSNFGALGARRGTHAAYRTVRTAAPADHTAWKVTLTGATANMTNFYGTNGNTIICQSCHTPHGANVVGGNFGSAGSKNILYVQNGNAAARTGVDGGGNVGGGQQTGYDMTADTICQACHVPTGTHAVQAWTVSRTAAALNPTSSFVLAAGPTDPADYSTNGMTCESCHVAHAAATAGGSFILEAAASATAPTGGERPDDRNRDALCALCHNY